MRTVGATEERFAVDKSLSYRIIDVGGSRFQRNVWASFFEDATAIIFLAPISAFDECLEEDAEVNRIADSLQIWRQIVVSPLLYGVSLILFLNSECGPACSTVTSSHPLNAPRKRWIFCSTSCLLALR